MRNASNIMLKLKCIVSYVAILRFAPRHGLCVNLMIAQGPLPLLNHLEGDSGSGDGVVEASRSSFSNSLGG